LRWLRRFTRDDRLLAIDCLDQVGLLAHATRRVDTMSGGERQRIALARALAQQPAVLLADEPVASLDPEAGATVLRLLRDCCRERQAAVVCSLHQPALALEHADRVVALRGGRVVLDAPAGALDASALAAIYR
jgi:phosphonate transport system ATP-binding protein